jgi:xanthine/CO dehydrogenase XdhC/CoxF family maturation factor
MTTHRAIVDALFKSANEAESVVLATVVRITGSSYGGVGTRMVARVDGSTVGVVSGGCLETDLAEHAREVNASGKPRVVTYDTRADDDTAWGLGLGCNGLIDVLLEPLSPVEAAGVGRLIEQALAAASPNVLATVIASSASEGAPSVGAHALFNGEVIESTGDWGDRTALAAAGGDVAAALSAGRRGLVREYDAVQVAFEIVMPAIRLVICGTGPDVLPLVRLSSQLGWDVTVVDHRPVVPEHEARYPGATLVECADALRLSECVRLTSATAAVTMSHNYARDLEYVRSLLASDAGYIGVLGPRARSERMLNEMPPDERSAAVTRIFAPVGMDIGGDGPEAIALSIIAEVSAVLGRRDGGHLRDRAAPLHG